MAKEHSTDPKFVNRREFVTRAGFITAASILLSPSLGCDVNVGINIPCLGPAAAPVPIPGMTYIRASQIGCALDCDLSNGRNKRTGGKATDDGPRINAAMASASASNPITLIIDGSAMISGLFLPAEGHWSIVGLGCGTGFFIKSGTNNDGIHNGGPRAGIPADPGPPAPTRGSSVALKNFTINGNQGDGRDGNSTTGSKQGITSIDPNIWYFGINLMNLDDIDIQNVVVVNTPSYHIRLSNVGNVTVTGCVFRSLGRNTDGLHFNGPANDITVANCDFTTGDDAIALNCPEGYTGNISRVTVTNCTFSSWTLMRLYPMAPGGSDRLGIDSVVVSGCSGRLGLAGFMLGQFKGSKPDAVADLTVVDCDLTAPAILELGVNFGQVTLRNVSLTPINTIVSPGYALARSTGSSLDCTYKGTTLIFENCVIHRKSDASVSALIVEYSSSITNVIFNGLVVNDRNKYDKIPNFIKIDSGSVGNVVINSLEGSHLEQLASFSDFTKISSVSGAGVLVTGIEFPDLVMADSVPYISATTGRPSIKVNGVVLPYNE